MIIENPIIKDIDDSLSRSDDVLAHKLCGAGNGGFFLIFSKKDTLSISKDCVKINISTDGVNGVVL
jgi:galactokinase/mevalonate kinase-like predicted kinase